MVIGDKVYLKRINSENNTISVFEAKIEYITEHVIVINGIPFDPKYGWNYPKLNATIRYKIITEENYIKEKDNILCENMLKAIHEYVREREDNIEDLNAICKTWGY